MSFLNQLNTNLLIVLITLLVIGLIDEINTSSAASILPLTQTTKDTCECHLRNFDLCSSHLILLSQPVPMMPPGDVFDRMCAFLNESYQCRQDFLNRCSTPSAVVMIKMMTQKNDAAFHSLCSQPEAAHWKSLYIASYYCLQSTKMLCRPCILDYHAGLEAALINETTQISGGCCAFNRLVTCTSDIIQNTCGADALTVSKKIGDIFASSVANNLCRNYPPESMFCRSILPSPGTIPKGDTFAYYTQIFGSNPGLSAPWSASSMGTGSAAAAAASKWTNVPTWNKNMKVN